MVKKSGSKSGGKKGGGKKAQAKASAKPSADPAKKAEQELLGRLDSALESGSYAGVHKLAEGAGSDLSPAAQAEVEERVALTRVDPVQVAVGLFAMLMVVVAVATTLTPASSAHKQAEPVEQTE